MRLISCFIAVFLLLAQQSVAQKQNNQWRFGTSGTVNFNTSPPSPDTGAVISTGEGSASVADRNTGELLFYSDGVRVWNRENQVMPNGGGLRGGSAQLLSSTTAAVIVPRPSNVSQYYLITIDEGATGTSLGVNYNLIDMNLDEGRGDVVSGQKNVFLFATGSEKLEVVPAGDGQSFWLITRKDTEGFFAFRITASGIQGTPVFSPLGDSNPAGHMKMNRQFNQLAMGNTSLGAGSICSIRLYDFDNSTGVFSNERIWTYTFSISLIYGVEFSPSGKFLYISNLERLVQYDISLANTTEIQNSGQIIAPVSAASLQLGPDNRIYANVGALGVIPCPDKPAPSCGFEFNPVENPTGGGGYGLPKWVYYSDDLPGNPKTNAVVYRDSCLGRPVQFRLKDTTGITSVSWNFGDPASGSNNSASGNQATHVFSQEGVFKVTAIINESCGFDTLRINNLEVRNCLPPCKALMKISGSPCQGSDLSFSLESASIIDSVKWDFGDSTRGSVRFSSLKEPVFRFSGIGSYTVQAIAFLSCGTDTIQKKLQIIDCDTACAGSIEVMVTDSCSGLARFQIKSKRNIQLLKWEFGDPASGILNSSSELMPQHQFSSSGLFKIKSVVLFDCGFDTLDTEISTQVCIRPPCEIQIPNAFTPNGDNVNDAFIAQSNCNFEEFELRIFNRWGQEIFFSRNPAVGWNGSTDSGNEASSDGIYFYSLRYRFPDGPSKLAKGYFKPIRS